MIAQFGLLLLAAVDSTTAQPTAAEIVQRMAHADSQRNSAFCGYTGMRHYTIQNKRFNTRAEASVRVICTAAGSQIVPDCF